MSKTSRTTVELGGSWQLAVLPDRLFRRHADETGFACSLSAWEAAGAVMLTADRERARLSFSFQTVIPEIELWSPSRIWIGDPSVMTWRTLSGALRARWRA